jgi:hypothetical protein
MININKPKGTIMNGQSRVTDNTGHTIYRMKTNKTKNTTRHRKLNTIFLLINVDPIFS